MDEKILNELQELKKLTLLSTKNTLTLSEAAMYLGLSKSHIYKLCMQRAIPYYKGSGNKFSFFDKSELDGWAKCRKVSTTTEIESDAANYMVTGKQKGGVAK